MNDYCNNPIIYMELIFVRFKENGRGISGLISYPKTRIYYDDVSNIFRNTCST